MHRRTFCHLAISAGIAAALPACSRKSNPAASSSTLAAVSRSGGEITISSSVVEDFAGALSGQLLRSTDAGYESARKLWNGMIDKQPALIAQCETTDDVVQAVNFARELDLLLAVRCGGHSLPGKSTCDGGLIIDLAHMHNVDVDTGALTARVDGGALLGHIDDATHAHKLGTTTGIVSHTGAGGFTLGGGYGRTDRLMGLAVDNLLAASIVTANGEMLRASESDNADLYWAIRGGGGNFGIATEFVYRLHHFNPTIYGGNVLFGLSTDFLTAYGELAAELPNEASIEPNLFVDKDGNRLVGIQVVYAGDHATGEKVMAPLLRLAKPRAVDLGAMEYRSFQTGGDVLMGRGKYYYLKSGLLTELSPGLAEVIVDHMNRDAPVGSWFQHLGGMPATVAPDAMAYSHRNAALNLGIMVIAENSTGMDEKIAKAREFYKDASPYMDGFYTNLNEESEKKTWGNYGENYPRLVVAKDKYDPKNLFHLNANIKPSV
jgi:FAD binding domain/Berberine and berberine like